MATIGQQLLQPETGWRRIDDTDSYIEYRTGFVTINDNKKYNNTEHEYEPLTTDNLPILKFKFKGTKFRIIGRKGDTDQYCTSVKITIDRSIYDSYTEFYSSGEESQALLYEKAGLSDEVHTVEIMVSRLNVKIWLDAIDIDDTGYLINPKIGQPLLAPESGWKRIDDTSSLLMFVNDGGILNKTNNSNCYNSTSTTTYKTYIKFKFIGSNLRIIGDKFIDHETAVSIKIDGVVETFSAYSSTQLYQILLYEKTKLNNNIEHTVEIYAPVGYFNLDAIDIDDTGDIIDISPIYVFLIKQNLKYYQLNGKEIIAINDNVSLEQAFKFKGNKNLDTLSKTVSDNLLKNGSYEILYYKSN